jgi:hypothetical protein
MKHELRMLWVVAAFFAAGVTVGWAQVLTPADTMTEISSVVAEASGVALPPVASGAVTRPVTPGVGAGIQPVVAGEESGDPCALPDVTSNPMRPNWSNGAATTQCGVIESDYGFLWQGMGAGVNQSIFPVSIRYGLTSKLELRWGLPTHMSQSGGGTRALQGGTDQWIGGLYRFQEQGARIPALALSYNLKIPTANPAKGFGSGYADHQLTFIASRDLKKLHFDFNTVGTLAGGRGGYDGAAQFGLALSVPVMKNVGWILESDGGPQPGTPDRFGQALTGVSWTMRPWLVLDAAYTQAYSAGSPRQQLTVGFTYARRPRALVRASGFDPGRLAGH